MIPHRSRSRRLHVGLALVACLAVGGPRQVIAQESEDVLVGGPRPLAAAIKEFAKRCRCVVTYEDVKWTQDQVEDARRRSDGKPHRVPHGVPFTFTVPRDLDLRSSAEIAQNLRLVLERFERSQNPGRFKIVRGLTALHVLPAHSAILERRISVTADDTPALNAVQVALESLTRASGEKVTLWTLPVNILKRPIRVTATDGPAYEVIARILATADKRLSWTLSYDVNENFYFMPIYAAY